MSETGGGVIYLVTCGLCGQSWQRGAVRDAQVDSCPFCGSGGRVRVGMIRPEGEDTQRVEVRLEPDSLFRLPYPTQEQKED